MSGIVAENSGRSSGLVKAGGVSAGSIETAHLANDAVTAAKCANDFISGFPGQDIAIADSILYQDSSAFNETRLTGGQALDEMLKGTNNKITGAVRIGSTTDADGSFAMNSGSNWIWVPTGSDTLEFTQESAGQIGWIFLDNSSGNSISLGSEVEADSSCASTLSGSGEYVIIYATKSTSAVQLIYSAAVS